MKNNLQRPDNLAFGWRVHKRSFPDLHPCRQRGSTLIEVLISMFILIFGVLVLMAAQLRSVTAVQEAENQTVVAQATQNLMEGMLANPTLSKGTDQNGIKRYTVKSYPQYASGFNSGNCTDAYSDTLTKAQLAQRQLCLFYTTVNNNLLNAVIKDVKISESNGVYTITTTWTMQGSGDADTEEYSYSLPVQD